MGDIYHPVWYAEDRIFVRTGRFDHGEFVAGIFDVAIEPATRAFRGIRAFAFPEVIRDYDYDVSTGDFALTFSFTSSDIQTVWARAEGDSLIAGDTIRDAGWYPLCARFVAEGGGLVLYAHDPSTSINGFYFSSRDGSGEDSLLYAVELTVADARGFDIAGGRLCFGQSDFSGPVKTTITVIDIVGDHTPRVVTTLNGVFMSASVHRAGTCAIISVDDFGLPGSVVGLLDFDTGSFTIVSTRTRGCGFPIADFASWNPAGNAFAFSASSFDGEGGLFPRQLWIRNSVVCR